MRLANASLALAALGLAAACAPPPVYTQRYAAVAPHAAPPLRTGAHAAHGGEVAFGDSSLAQLRAPREGDPDVGLVIPRSQPRLELRGGNGQFDLGLIGVYGARRDATELSDDVPTPEGGGVFGVGAALGMTRDFPGSPWSLALSGELVAYRVPYVVQQTCVENCFGDLYVSDPEQHDAMVPAVSLSIVPSYRFAHASLFAGLTLQNHPVIVKGDVDVGYVPDEEEPEAGPMVGVFSAGVEIDVFSNVRLAAMVYQPLARDPVDYGPALSAFVTIPFGDTKPAAAPPAAPAPAPAPYGPPPAYPPTPVTGSGPPGS